MKDRALTVRQPWAWAIVSGHKPIENRTWPPPAWLIGSRLWIHAGQRVEPEGLRFVAELGLEPGELVRGAVIGAVLVTGVAEDSDDPWWTGPLGWTLADARPCSPVSCAGRLGLFTLPEDVLRLLAPSAGRSTRTRRKGAAIPW